VEGTGKSAAPAAAKEEPVMVMNMGKGKEGVVIEKAEKVAGSA
jgi:hypothetical protein